MSYVSKFKYNTAYSNTDIQEALSVITGSGVTIGSPNGIAGEVATEGVTFTYGQCAVTVSGSIATIATGSVIMRDGSYITIEEPETFEISLSDKYYVFIEEIAVGNNVPKCETALPEQENVYVLLAEINNGVVTDKRIFASSKIETYGGHTTLTKLTKLYSANNSITYSIKDIGYITGVLFPTYGSLYEPVIYFLKDNLYFSGDDGFSTIKGKWYQGPAGAAYIKITITEDTLTINNIKAEYSDELSTNQEIYVF